MSNANNPAPVEPIDHRADSVTAAPEAAEVTEPQATAEVAEIPEPEAEPAPEVVDAQAETAPEVTEAEVEPVPETVEVQAEPAPEAEPAAEIETAPSEEAVSETEIEQVPEEETVPETVSEVGTAPEIETSTAAEVAADVVPEPEKVSESVPAEEVAAETVDFSDEQATLDAEAAGLDLGEEREGEENAVAAADNAGLASKTKSQLTELLAELLAAKPVQTLRGEVEAIKVAFYKLHRAETEAQRKAWTDAGGDAEGFTAPADPTEARLKELIGEYRRRRDEFLTTLDAHREENLKAKLAIIEELKSLVNAGETVGHTFNSFRELQQRWREVGPVPLTAVKDLWETYNHHVENFYSFIKINKELRDLDLKRNYEAKLALCEEAEALVLDPSIVGAFHRLQKLHDQWRETGPVAAEFKEAVWERFREASGRINRQQQSHFDEIKEEQKKNLDLKSELCAQVEALSREPFTSRKEWNRANDRLLEIQKVWKTIGFAPKKNNTRVYERFRTACDAFFDTKRKFYNQLKGEAELNLAAKNEICQAAEALAASEDWRATSDALIALQKRWKEIGPVPRRHSDAVWKRFRAACDAFFERKSGHFSGVEGGYKENLEKKRALLAAAEARGYDNLTFDDVKEFQRQWGELGFVPIKQKESVAKQYKAVVDRMFTSVRGADGERSMERFRGRVASMKSGGGGGGRLRTERDRLFNKVKQLEGDIATLENNIGFFGHSKNAEAMIADVREKIVRARDEMARTIEKINLIDAENE